MKRDVFWVFKSFGFLAGIRFLWDTLVVRVKRLLKGEKVKRFEDLTDAEAEQVAWAFGIYKWEDRDHLNRIWHNFDRTLH